VIDGAKSKVQRAVFHVFFVTVIVLTVHLKTKSSAVNSTDKRDAYFFLDFS